MFYVNSQAHKRIYGSHDLVAFSVVYTANRGDITWNIRSFFSYLFTASTAYLASSSPHCFGFSLIRERRRGRVAIIVLRHSQATNKSVVF